MDSLNRIASPMHYFDENSDLPFHKQKENKKKLRQSQRANSPFMIGSIDRINRRISRLDKTLSGFSTLLCDSADPNEAPSPIDYQQNRKRLLSPYVRVRDKHDETVFAGVYAVKSTFAFDTSDRVKKIAQISETRKLKSNIEKNAPKFIELYQFSGFNENVGNPLPYEVDAKVILDKLVKSKLNGKKRKFYLEIILSKESKIVFEDLFWYVYIHKFGSILDRGSLDSLLKRIATNYVRFLNLIPNLHKDPLMKFFIDIIPQAIYSAFCYSFPDSYSLLATKEFKNTIITTVYYWLAGIAPQNDLWQNWDNELLEPIEARQREQLMRNGSQDEEKPNDRSWFTKSLDEIRQKEASIGESATSSNFSRGLRAIANNNKTPSQFPTGRKRLSVVKNESLPLGPGPGKKDMYFSTTGRSPLVSLFMQGYQLDRDAGSDYLISRTEIEPWDLLKTNQTHATLIQESKTKADERRKAFTEKYLRDVNANKQFVQEQRKKMQELTTKLSLLLTDKKEVHRLSNLIVLERQKDSTSLIPVGADQAVERALETRIL